MIKVLVIVSGLTLGQLPTSDPTQPIVFLFPKAQPGHKATIYVPPAQQGGSMESHDLGPRYSVSLVKKCSGSCPASTFPGSSMDALPVMQKLAPSNEVMAACRNPSSVADCRRGSAELLDGKLVLEGGWNLEMPRTDCDENSFPIRLSDSGRNLFREQGGAQWPDLTVAKPFGDSIVLGTEVADLGVLELAGTTAPLRRGTPTECKAIAGVADCALLMLRNQPATMQSGPFDRHFGALYDLLGTPPNQAKRWLPWLESGEYCPELSTPEHRGKRRGAGHPRCMGGVISQ